MLYLVMIQEKFALFMCIVIEEIRSGNETDETITKFLKS